MKLLGIEEALDGDKFLTCRVLNHIPRWSTVPIIRRQTVGEHCFLVARYCILILDYIEIPVNRGVLLNLALIHDDDELKTGDLPSPSKKDTNFDMPTVEHGLVKVADRLEAYCYTQEETALGNNIMDRFTEQTWKRYVETMAFFMNKYKGKLYPHAHTHEWFNFLGDPELPF